MAESISNESGNWSSNLTNFEEQTNEVLAIKSFYENTDNLEIIQEASIENEQLYSLKFQIKAETQTKPLLVELRLPIENFKNYDLKLQENDTVAVKKENLLERTISGYHVHTEFINEYLLPITLVVRLPVTYPSISAPRFTISCMWLNETQLSKLCLQMDKLWRESSGMPIIYTWIEWLQTNTIKFLDIFEEPNKIIATPLNNDLEEADSRAISQFNDAETCIYKFLEYNYAEELRDFQNEIHTCGLCLDEKYGSEFYRLNRCKHKYCSECFVSFCKIHVKEGSVRLLNCPEKDCKEEIPVDLLQIILSKQEFERWELLMTLRTLDSMGNILYCPRCNSLTMFDENDQHILCSICNMNICRKCKKAWHMGSCHSEIETIVNKIKELKLTPEQLMRIPDDVLKEKFNDGNHLLRLKKQYQKSEQLMLKMFLHCPKCGIAISKVDGCNKVVCICGTILCYLCGKQIYGYQHFTSRSTCTLFSYSTTLENIVRAREQKRNMAQQDFQYQRAPNIQNRNTVRCPSCYDVCFKEHRNNHIKCSLCNIDFCFLCKTKIQGAVTAHFRKTICKQHTD